MASIRGMHSGFVPRVFETSYKAHLFRLRGNDRRADQTEELLERLLEDARNAPNAPSWWKSDVRAAAARGRQAARDHFEALGPGRKGANPFRKARRDPDDRIKAYYVGQGNSSRPVSPDFRTLAEAERWAAKNVKGFYGVYSTKVNSDYFERTR